VSEPRTSSINLDGLLREDKLTRLRNQLIVLRNECLGPAVLDADGAVILSHAIRWLWFKIEGKPYERETD
jgi:hypothetical protein